MTCDCRQYDYTRTVDCTAVIFNVTKNSLCDSTFATQPHTCTPKIEATRNNNSHSHLQTAQVVLVYNFR